MTGFVYLIGAGCGAYDLITLRGLEALKKCNTVVCDALADSDLREYAREDAEFIYVGKRSGKHSASQDEINAILAEKALAGHTVARLKGGDPFVFGRGGEEIVELRKQGIPFTVIPGISSCIAVPELAGIPVTHRSVSREFHVITAHTAEGTGVFTKYAALEGTTVFLMGLNALGRIAEDLIKGGKSPDTPAAVISEGCTAGQRTVRGTLENIAGLAADMKAPAVIVVGETAGYDFSGTAEKQPLSGITVTVTGTRKFTGKLSALLGAEGAEIRRYSNIKVIKSSDIPSLDGYGCIAFTSSYGAEMFMQHIRETHTDIRSLAGILFAAVGSGTAETLSGYGINPDIIPGRYTVGELALAIAEKVPLERKILILRAGRGSEELCRVLSEKGMSFDDVKIYDTVPANNIPPLHADTDYIVFGSSFGAESFFGIGGTLSDKTAVICIGAQTAGAVQRLTANRLITAYPHTAQGAADAIKEDIRK